MWGEGGSRVLEKVGSTRVARGCEGYTVLGRVLGFCKNFLVFFRNGLWVTGFVSGLLIPGTWVWT